VVASRTAASRPARFVEGRLSRCVSQPRNGNRHFAWFANWERTTSQVGRVAPAQRPRWDSRRRLRLALALLADASLDVLVTGESPFDDLPAVMASLAQAPGDTLCHRIRY
jgi:hypothetical protein